MPNISQNSTNEVALLDCIQRFFQAPCRKTSVLMQWYKGKGGLSISLLRYKLSIVFQDRNMYIQQRTGTFKENFSKNTFIECYCQYHKKNADTGS